MRDAENIREVEKMAEELSIVNSQLSIAWMGFIFWPKSSRYVSERPAYLPTKCKRVGVFVDASIDDIRQHTADYALDIIQLHGSESPDYVRALCDCLVGNGETVASQLRSSCGDSIATRQLRSSCGDSIATRQLRSLCGDSITIIKAFNIATKEDLDATKPYEGIVDYFLFDTKGKSVGGNGEKFDWRVLASYAGETPFLLSGGIGPDDAELILQAFALDGFPVEKCLGIDLNSRFELAPALKDVTSLARFLNKLNNMN